MLYETRNPHGGDIYGDKKIRMDFSANINPLGTPSGVLKAVEASLPELVHYPDPYCRKLVYRIAEYEGVPERFILCGNGAAELIYSYCEALRPHTAVELAPTFSEYALGLERVGCEVRRFPLESVHDFILDRSFLFFLEKTEPDAVFLCNPNNPTGRLLDAELIKEILLFTCRHGIRLFLDECFLDLTDCGVSLKTELESFPNLFCLKAFTKSYGMAGLRLGYCLTGDRELLQKMAKTVQPWNVSVPAQAAGIAALSEEAFLRKTKEIIKTERTWLTEELKAVGFTVCPSDANFILFRGPSCLQDDLLDQGIAIRNCENYLGLSAGWFRIAVKQHEENQILISAIRRICGKEPIWQRTL